MAYICNDLLKYYNNLKLLPMKKLVTICFLLHFSLFVFGQSNDWKRIATPRSSYVDIIYQNQKGEILANSVPRIGLVKSNDEGKTWNFIDSTNQYVYEKSCIENLNGELYFFSYNKIYKLNFTTGVLDTFYVDPKINKDFIQLSSIGNDIVVALDKNGYLYMIKPGNNELNWYIIKKVVKLMPTFLSDKAFCINEYNGEHFLNQINADGTYKQLSKLSKTGKKYFYHNNILINDNTFSTDLGQTWSQFNLPFTEPDTIYLYNKMLAFGKDNKVYYKDDNASSFNIITLPSNTDVKHTFVGKNIITQDIDQNINDTKILRDQNGSFEPLQYNISFPYVDEFVAGNNEQILANYLNNDVYFKNENNTIWSLLPFKSYRFSLSEDNFIDIIDNDSNIQTSSDKGVSWQKYVQQGIKSNFYSKKNGVFTASRDGLFYRKAFETNWHYKAIENKGGSELIEISNQADIYKNHWGAEQLTQSDTFNNLRNLKDIRNFGYRTTTHHEMNYFYNLADEFRPSDRYHRHFLSSSYDRGFTFTTLYEFPWSNEYFSDIVSTPSGHLILVKKKEIMISSDEGKTWEQVKVDLSERDYITNISVSPDYYIYISTLEKGILKYKDPLSIPNIIKFNLKEDYQSDCDDLNDISSINERKISIKGLSSQLTDKNGDAVFYSHSQQNNLFVHNENDIFDLCKDTIPVNFSSGGGQSQIVNANATTRNQCAQLEMKIVNYRDAYIFGSNYYILIKNTGNTKTDTTRARIYLDPYQYLYENQFNTFPFTKIAEGVYDAIIPPLDPFGEFSFNIITNLVPYVPFDRSICLDVKLMDHNDQCKPYTNITKCNPVNRVGKNKTIALKFFEDANADCIKDPLEKYTTGHFYIMNNERDMILDYDSTKYIITSLDTNNISFVYNDKLYSFCQVEYTVSMHKDSLIYTLEIPIRTLDHCSDIELKGIHGIIRPCFENGIGLNLINSGNVTSGAINVKLNLDPNFLVSSVNPTPVNINGNEYEFVIDPIEPLRNKLVQIRGTVDCNSPIGTEYCFSSEIKEGLIANCQLNNNINNNICIKSIGSFDPNDKTIFVSGKENVQNIQKDELIEYRIRFQNTGTDTAYTVRIEDKLSEKFDIRSVRLTNYSHECTWKIENKILIVTFDKINLVDSFTNNEASNGFVVFEIKLKADIKINDEIRNRASIYFDFNEPIVTNEVINYFGNPISTVKDKLQVADKIDEIICVPNPTSNSFKVLIKDPSDKSDILIFDTNGRLCKVFLQQTLSNDFNISELHAGTYIIKILNYKGISQGRFIKL